MAPVKAEHLKTQPSIWLLHSIVSESEQLQILQASEGKVSAFEAFKCLLKHGNVFICSWQDQRCVQVRLELEMFQALGQAALDGSVVMI